MTSTQIETNVQNLVKSLNTTSFIYDLLLAYDKPRATIERLKKSEINLVDKHVVVLRKEFYFKELNTEQNAFPIEEIDINAAFKALINDPKTLKYKPRLIILTNYTTLLAFDTKTKETLSVPIIDLPKHFDFFFPLWGREKAEHQDENPADVKAAQKMGKLYEEIEKDNPTKTLEAVHNLNVFLSRLLFCFFAEDTEIFNKNIFTHAITEHTQKDGSDLNAFLTRIFEVLNTKKRADDLPIYLTEFPYVNGGLFKNTLVLPTFSAKSRSILLECGGLDWAAINPDIFGSMIQSVVLTEQRGSLGMHYTSVPNILKVIEPLFLDDLKAEFEKHKNHENKLKQLLIRLTKIKIFDPACGSGNFLIIAYKELRKLEMLILKQINILAKQQKLEYSGITLTQFYGIEINDFAHEIAILSLWLAKHQMDVAFKNELGVVVPALPLTESSPITHGNATRLNWAEIYPYTEGGEVFVLGNPPYLGSSVQSLEQKEDMAFAFKGIEGYKNLDYIACWFLNGSKFIEVNKNAQCAFVTTNSICQGEQVALLWPHIFNKNQEISFAHLSFKWKNNAQANAAVIVAIIGLRTISNKPKYIFKENTVQFPNNINAYLADGNNSIIIKRTKPLANINEMDYGSKAVDGGHLTLTFEEKNEMLLNNPNAKQFIRKYIGSNEFINGLDRYCLWITKNTLEEALTIKDVEKRIKAVEKMRLDSKKEATKERAKYSYEFGEMRHRNFDCVIVVPRVSSERRHYIPFGFLFEEYVVSDSAQAIYNAAPYTFGIISSRMHMTWVRAVAGRLKTDYRYSSSLCYNTFPFPDITDAQKAVLKEHVYEVLDQRKYHTEKTLAELYDPDKMPEDLRLAHHQLDLAVEKCYRSRVFESDEERLAYLFKLYEKMVATELAP